MSDVNDMLTEAYRPHNLDEVVGLDRAKKQIGAWLRTGRIPRTILIHGVLSAGKTSLARIIGRFLLCQEPDGIRACGECKACKRFGDDGSNSQDYIEMNAASDRGIDAMRSLAQKLPMRPLGGKKKIVVLDEAHQITAQGWDAMLKPLENPPEHVILLVLTTNPEKIKGTILSRCQKVKLPNLTVEECSEVLTRIAKDVGLAKAGLTKKHLVKIAKVTGGSPRAAIHALDAVYTMVLDASEAGQTVDDALVASFIKQVSETDTEVLSAGIVRSVLEGKPAGALARAADADDPDQLLYKVTEMMRQAMLRSTRPKLMDPYYKEVLSDISIFKHTDKDEPHHMEGRQAVLEAYACFTRLRIETATHMVPVSEVIGEAIARAALICQRFRKEYGGTPKPKPKKAKPREPEVDEGHELADEELERPEATGSSVLKRKPSRAPAAKLPN